MERQDDKEIDKRAEIYLTDEEIDAMYDMELTGENEIVRDIFLLGYFSCQRYSDYCKLREENFITYNKSGLITLTQKKNGKKVEVPILMIVSMNYARSITIIFRILLPRK